MSKLAFGLILSVATAFALPAVSAAKPAAADKSEAAAPLDKEAQQKLKDHLRMRDHIVQNVRYPATKESLVTTLKGARAIKADDKQWLEKTLPSKTYDTPDDVMKALGWEVTPAAKTTAAKNGK